MSPMPADAVVDVVQDRPVDAPDPIAHERCDRCGHRAHVVTIHTGGLPLAWCGHHFRRHETALGVDAGVVIAHDTRAHLIPTQRA